MEFVWLSAVKVGHSEIGGDAKILKIAFAANGAHYEILKLFYAEKTAAPELKRCKISERTFAEQSQHIFRRNSGGMQYCNNGTSADSGNNVGF